MRAQVTHASERASRGWPRRKRDLTWKFFPYVWIRGTAFSSAKTIHSPRQPVRRAFQRTLSPHPGPPPWNYASIKAESRFPNPPQTTRDCFAFPLSFHRFFFLLLQNTTARVTCRLNGLASVAEYCNAAITFCVYWLLDGILQDIARSRDFTIHGNDRANRKCVHLVGDVRVVRRGLQYRCFMDVSGLI